MEKVEMPLFNLMQKEVHAVIKCSCSCGGSFLCRVFKGYSLLSWGPHCGGFYLILTWAISSTAELTLV